MASDGTAVVAVGPLDERLRSGQNVAASGLVGEAAAQVNILTTRRSLPKPLIRVVHSRVLNNVVIGATTTYEMLAQTAAPIGRAMPLLCVGNNAAGDATSPAFFVSMAPVPNATKAAADAAAWTTVGMQSPTLTPATALNKRAWHRSADFVKFTSVERDDGGKGYLTLIRAQIAAGTVVMLGNGTDNFTNWATEDYGMFRWREKPGSYATANQAGFDSVNNLSRSPIAGLAYIPRDGRGITGASKGDSNAVGYGEHIGMNHMFLACKALTEKYGIPYEYADLAWGGFASTAIRDMTIDLFGSGGLFASGGPLAPDFIHMPLATQNDWPTSPTASTLTATDIASMEGNLAQARALVARAGIPLIRSTWQASQARVWGVSDILRRDRNAQQRLAGARNGEVWVDVAAVIDDVPDGTGQAPMKVAYTKDPAHFNDAGHLAVAPYSAAAIDAVVGVPAGAFFAPQ